MPAEIVLTRGGDHRFDLHHLRRQGGEELARLLLREAGHDAGYWEVRVEKKFACGSGTRPVSVVGCKPWCCYVKIKPGDNNSGHYCSFLMPDGLNGEAVYGAFKEAEVRVNSRWRSGVGERAPVNGSAPAPLWVPLAPPKDVPVTPEERPRPAPASIEGEAHSVPQDHAPEQENPVQPSEAESEQDNAPETPDHGPNPLRSWARDADKLPLTLLAIEEVAQAGLCRSKNQFVEALAERLGWQGARRQDIGGVFRSLVRRGFIDPVSEGSRDVGYVLADAGRQLIGDLLPAETAPAPRAHPPAGQPNDLLLDLTGMLREYSESAEKLRANRARRAEILAELERLDAEARQLNQIVEDPDVRQLLERLVQARKKRPGATEG